jgi:hypothetical protein
MENKPIYCFKLDNETFELTRIEITDYKIHRLNEYGRFRYKWENPKINKCDRYYYLEPKKMDRFVNYKVFTLNPDAQNALNIIKATLEKQLDEFTSKIKRTQIFLENIKRINDNDL